MLNVFKLHNRNLVIASLHEILKVDNVKKLTFTGKITIIKEQDLKESSDRPLHFAVPSNSDGKYLCSLK